LFDEHHGAQSLKEKVDNTVLIELCKTEDRMEEIACFVQKQRNAALEQAIYQLLKRTRCLSSSLFDRLNCKISFDPGSLVQRVIDLGNPIDKH
jgi:hypothetical protein